MTQAQQVVTLTLGVLTILGLAVRYVLVPYLRTALRDAVAPVSADVREVRKQVTENHHSNPEPTLPDRLADVRSDIADLSDAVKASNLLMGSHVDWSQEWTSRIEKDVDALKGQAVEDAARFGRIEADIAALRPD